MHKIVSGTQVTGYLKLITAKNENIVYIRCRSLLIVYLAITAGAVSNPATAMGIASTKTSLTFLQAFTRGVLCNWLVCMAGTYYEVAS